MLAYVPSLIMVPEKFPANTIQEFIALAKSKPGGINYGSSGMGGAPHLAVEMLNAMAGLKLVHVPYKSVMFALVDLMGGQVQMTISVLPAALPMIRQGKLRALGVTSKKRSPQLPNVPAIAETIAGFENIGWFGLMVAAGTPKEIVEKIYRDTVRALEAPDIKSRFEGLGMAPVGNSPADFAKAIREETETWGKIVRERKLVVE